MTARENASGRLPVRVVKVGGSLFDWAGLPEALTSWLDRQPPGLSILIAGGGELAEAIRRADAIHGLGEERSHWLCIDAMSRTARLLATLMKVKGPPVTDFADLNVGHSLREWPAPRVNVDPTSGDSRSESPTLTGWLVFDPAQFLRETEPHEPGHVLPHTWEATSDSIAARLAEVLQAEELVLLKSQDPPPDVGLAELAVVGYVDEFFPHVAACLSVRVVNLRREPLLE